MKKVTLTDIFKYSAIALFLSTTLTACGSDDDPINTPVVEEDGSGDSGSDDSGSDDSGSDDSGSDDSGSDDSGSDDSGSDDSGSDDSGSDDSGSDDSGSDDSGSDDSGSDDSGSDDSGSDDSGSDDSGSDDSGSDDSGSDDSGSDDSGSDDSGSDDSDSDDGPVAVTISATSQVISRSLDDDYQAPVLQIVDGDSNAINDVDLDVNFKITHFGGSGDQSKLALEDLNITTNYDLKFSELATLFNDLKETFKDYPRAVLQTLVTYSLPDETDYTAESFEQGITIDTLNPPRIEYQAFGFDTDDVYRIYSDFDDLLLELEAGAFNELVVVKMNDEDSPTDFDRPAGRLTLAIKVLDNKPGADIYEGIGSTSLTDTNTMSYPVNVLVADTDENAVTFNFTINVEDTISPALTLVGNTEITFTLGETFEDPGVTANDSFEGDITENVSVSLSETDSTVLSDLGINNTEFASIAEFEQAINNLSLDDIAEGTFVIEITYNAEDSAENSAAPVSRALTIENEVMLAANYGDIAQQPFPAKYGVYEIIDDEDSIFNDVIEHGGTKYVAIQTSNDLDVLGLEVSKLVFDAGIGKCAADKAAATDTLEPYCFDLDTSAGSLLMSTTELGDTYTEIPKETVLDTATNTEKTFALDAGKKLIVIGTAELQYVESALNDVAYYMPMNKFDEAYGENVTGLTQSWLPSSTTDSVITAKYTADNTALADSTDYQTYYQGVDNAVVNLEKADILSVTDPLKRVYKNQPYTVTYRVKGQISDHAYNTQGTTYIVSQYESCKADKTGNRYSSSQTNGQFSFNSSTVAPVYSNPLNILDGQWHQVAISLKSPTSIKVCVDGNCAHKDTSIADWSSSVSSYANLNIGGIETECNGFTRGFKGAIDEVRVYNRSLSDDEIKGLSKGYGYYIDLE